MNVAEVLTIEAHEMYRTTPHNDPNRESMQNAFAALWDAAGRFVAVAEAVTSHRELRREEEHEEAITAGREQLAVVEGLEREIQRWESMVGQLEQKRSQAGAEFASLKEAQPNVNRFPTKQEIAEWQRSVKSAEQAHEAAMERLRSHNGSIGRMRIELQQERGKLQEMRVRESSLRSAAEKVQPSFGASFDANTGLSMSPAKYPQVSA